MRAEPVGSFLRDGVGGLLGQSLGRLLRDAAARVPAPAHCPYRRVRRQQQRAGDRRPRQADPALRPLLAGGGASDASSLHLGRAQRGLAAGRQASALHSDGHPRDTVSVSQRLVILVTPILVYVSPAGCMT